MISMLCTSWFGEIFPASGVQSKNNAVCAGAALGPCRIEVLVWRLFCQSKVRVDHQIVDKFS